MSGEHLALLLASGAFLVAHIGLAGRGPRGVVTRAVGEPGYRALYSLLALGLLVWMSIAFARAPTAPLWGSLAGLRQLPLVVMPFALLLVVAGVSTPNPGSLGQEALLAQPDSVRGILRVTRHPVNMAVALWAGAHLLAMGDLAALLFFGALFLLGALGPLHIDRKRQAASLPGWEGFAASTSVLPLGAVLTGRNRIVPGEIGWRRLAVTAALYVALIAAHPLVLGVRAY